MIAPRPTLPGDERGATLVEFAMVAPIMLMVLFGLIELGYRHYILMTLHGALQKSARNSTIERHAGATATATTDLQLQNTIKKVAPRATFVSTRKIYTTFSDERSAEHYVDSNSNGKYDAGECFEDVNVNSKWDTDRGRDGNAGQAGPDDLVRYTVSVTYPLLFPLGKMLGWAKTTNVEATTLLKNQPYGVQTAPSYSKCV